MKKATTTTTKTTKTATKTEKAPATKADTAPETKVSKKNVNNAARDTMFRRVDTWLAEYTKEQEAAGNTVIIKTWEKIPNCRALRVNNVTYFEIYISVHGARLNAKSKLICPELDVPGATIVKNGLDFCIPTFSDIEANLSLYAKACELTLARLAKEKEEAKKAKAEAAKKAKEEAKKAKASKKDEKAA